MYPLRMPRPTPPPFAYETRCVIFVDILGWSALVRRSTTDAAARSQIAKAYDRFSRTTRFVQGMEATDPERELGWAATFLSDSIAFSCRPEHASALLDHVASDFAFLLLRQELYVRGAIVLGEVYHRGDVIIGPALVDAVEHEKAACFPRIVVADTAASLVPEEMTLRDVDGVRFLNFLALAAANEGVGTNNLRRAREVVERKLAADAASPVLMTKHQWLARYISSLEDS